MLLKTCYYLTYTFQVKLFKKQVISNYSILEFISFQSRAFEYILYLQLSLKKYLMFNSTF